MEKKFQQMFDKVKTAAVNVGQSAAKGARKAGSKAGELLDAGKIKVKIADKKGDLKLLYMRLGEIAYSKSVGEEVPEGREDELCSSIAACKGLIAELEAQLAGVREEKICPNCGCACSEVDDFCSECGAVLNVEADKNESV